MSDITPWNFSQGFGNSGAGKQGRRELEKIAIDHVIKTTRVQAKAAETAVAVNSVITLVHLMNNGLKECPEAAGLVAPLVQGYAHWARMQTEFDL